MFDPKRLLGDLVQAGMTRSGGHRIERAVGHDGAGGMLGGVMRELKAGNPLAIGGLGALAGAVLGGGKGNLARGAVGGGALALLGSLAYSALQGRVGSQPGPAPSQPVPGSPASSGEIPIAMREPQTPADETVQRSQALLLLQAMISAAKADGQIDGVEMERILARLDEVAAEPDAKSFVLAEMRRPLDLDGLVKQVTSLEVAAEVYAASLLAIEIDTQAERDYLRRLAQGLRLDAAVVSRLHQVLGAPTPA